MGITKALLSAKLRATLVTQPQNSLPLQILACKYDHGTYHGFCWNGDYLNVLESTLDIWVENLFFAKRLQKSNSKIFVPLLWGVCYTGQNGEQHPMWQRMTTSIWWPVLLSFLITVGKQSMCKKHLLPADCFPHSVFTTQQLWWMGWGKNLLSFPF